MKSKRKRCTLPAAKVNGLRADRPDSPACKSTMASAIKRPRNATSSCLRKKVKSSRKHSFLYAMLPFSLQRSSSNEDALTRVIAYFAKTPMARFLRCAKERDPVANRSFQIALFRGYDKVCFYLLVGGFCRNVKAVDFSNPLH